MDPIFKRPLEASVWPNISAGEDLEADDGGECYWAARPWQSRGKQKPQQTIQHDKIFAAHPDNIYSVSGAKFYLPNCRKDLIQKHIAITGTFFEEDQLRECDRLLPPDSIIVDVGGNIGNHSIYWATQMKAKKVFAFEPLAEVADIFAENIELNGLQNVVQLNRIALSDRDEQLSVKISAPDNVGATQLKKGGGNLTAKKLDSLDLGVDRIDFVKIDVEGFELAVLHGAQKTFEALRPPYIYVEIFPKSNPSDPIACNPQHDEVFAQLQKTGYVLEQEFPLHNYLFRLANSRAFPILK